MATIRSYTTVEQSRKLAEILPIESADMTYRPIKDIDSMSNSGFLNIPDCYPFNEFKDCNIKPLPCWSLAALFGVLPRYELNNFGETIQLDVNREALSTEGDETLLDLVVNMVIHLHEQNLL